MAASPFIDEDFLLRSSVARDLFHGFAKDMPIIDYHCHLPPDELAKNENFRDLSHIWLAGDHYKWRAMRTLGIDEKYITGSATPWEKFEKWARTVPYAMRNPLYHWTHLELQRYFGIDLLLTPDTAAEVFTHCNKQLASPDFRPQAIVQSMNVEVVCTTDDPCDSLEHHQQLAKSDLQVYPAFRPDKAILINNPVFSSYIQQLGETVSREITSFSLLLEALKNRVDYFHENGCRISDHGLEKMYSARISDEESDRIFKKVITGEQPTSTEFECYAATLLYHLGKMYHQKEWVMQFHLGALRNTNERMARVIGADSGFDSIGEWPQAYALMQYLNRLDNEDCLTKTILYGLNPKDNPVLATMIGNYNDGSIRGKMQFGSAWWYLDQKDGMEEQINVLSNMGLISCFIGMLTDSRSFLSYPRHEYFRRILCNLLGADIVSGELPNDVEWIGKLVKDICYYNAKEYFNF